MIEADWSRWDAIPLPDPEKLNYWNEPYAEFYDWYPWALKFYTQYEIDHDALHVSTEIATSARIYFGEESYV